MSNTVVLRRIGDLPLSAVPPFNFKYTVFKPSHFPTPLEHFDEEDHCLYRTYRLNQDTIVGLTLKDLRIHGGGDGILAEVNANKRLDPADLSQVKEHLTWAFGLKEDVTQFYAAAGNDEPIASCIQRLNGMRISCFESLFEILNISSLLQNTTVKRSEQMMRNMLGAFGRRVSLRGRHFYVFYTPSDIATSSEVALRELKVGYRAKFLMAIAEHFAATCGFEDQLRTLAFDEAKKRLMAIRGIGPYSARIALFQFLRRPNEINFDSWKRKIFSQVFYGNETASIAAVEEEAQRRWGAWAGYAGLYVIEDLFLQHPEMQYWRKRETA